MQPVNNNRLQHQAIPSQQGISILRESSPRSAERTQRDGALTLPEDVVNLSMDRSSIPDSSVNKKSSVPVTLAEKKALRESFSVYA